ncbi:MAG TPA: peptidoglycan DD-metalloendopeptidase family protein [Candidatus Kapabacteria bacterium]
MKKFTFAATSATTLVIAFALVILLNESANTARRHPHKRSAGKHAATNGKRSSTEAELKSVQQEIRKYESELKEHERREKHSKETLNAFNKKEAELKGRIVALEREEKDLSVEKSEVDRSLNETSVTLESRKEAYARSSRELYVRGLLQPQDQDPLLTATNDADPTRMAYYAETIAKAHAMDRTRLDSMKSSLGASSAELASTIETAQAQIGAHQEEQTDIEQQRREEATNLAQIQAKKERVEKLLAERKASEKRLESIIAGLLSKENAPRRRTGRHRDEEAAPPESLGPAHGPHSLHWPTSSHRIVQGYGEHTNPELGTVTINLGVDIGTPGGSEVRAAAEGEVALISSLPSYGIVIVLRHSGELHTVYANLSSASVRQGAQVRAGETIGKSGTSEMSGAALHFEVWKGKTKQNPAGWLK